MQKPKPKGTPGRREQNFMFLVGGLLAGILGTVIVIVMVMTRPEPVQIAPTQIPSNTPIPTEIPSLTPSFTPSPTYTPSPLPPANVQATTPPLVYEPMTTHPVRSIAVSPNGTLLAIAYEYEGRGMLDLRRLVIENGSLTGDAFQLIDLYRVDRVAFSPSGDKLLSMSDTVNAVQVFNVASRTLMASFDGYNRGAFSSDGTTVILGGENGLAIADAATLELRRTKALPGVFQTLDTGQGNRLAVAYIDQQGVNRVRLYDLNNLDDESYIPMMSIDAPAWDVKFSPNGTLLAVSFGDHITLYNLAGSDVEEFEMIDIGHAGSLAFSPDNTWLAGGGGDFDLGFATGAYVWQRDPSGTKGIVESRYLPGHAHDVTSVAFTPDGRYLITASRDGSIRAWDYANAGAEVAMEPI